MDVEEFVAVQLPNVPSRLLEVGCGSGELALALAQRGHTLTAIDPDAPEGAIFRKSSLEDFADPEPFDAIIANRSLHHIGDIHSGVTKIRGLLRKGGTLIVNEFAWDQMDEKTVRWYLSHVPKPGPEQKSLLPGRFPQAWISEHEGLHDSIAMRRALDDLFRLKLFEWVPYITDYYLERPDLIDEELDLIQSGMINALGFRFVGIRR
jgi:SAM-dependent methyltransferase